MKTLSGNDWGCSKGTLTVTYKASGRSVLNFGAPIWSPSLSNKNSNNLQVQQNIALRTIIDELHSETKVLPVQTDTDMLATQFLVRCHKSHRSDYQTTQNPVERFIKHTLRTTHGVEIQQYLDEGLIISKLSESSEGYPSQPG